MAKVRRHLIIFGRVQGVAYRAHTEREALRRNLTGWVRNLPDGSVEALFEGEETEAASMVAWCRQGPPSSHVDKIQVSEETYQGDLRGFRILR